MSSDFLSIIVDDPRLELGGISAGLGALAWLPSGGAGHMDVFALLAAGFGLPGALGLWLAVGDAAISARLAQRGVEARGRVIGVARVWPTRRCSLRYRFRVDSGAEIGGRRFLSRDDAAGWRAGDEGIVRFESGYPWRNVWLGVPAFERPATERKALPCESQLFWRSPNVRRAVMLLCGFAFTASIAFAMTIGLLTGSYGGFGAYAFFALLAGGLLVAGLYRLIVGRREAAEGARILREGGPAEAVVVSMEEKVIRGRGTRWSLGWTVYYAYQDGTGRTYQGESGFLTESEVSGLRIGAPCPVWFDPRKPASNVWAGTESGDHV